jgi:C_GCAxxG_C_C family probable redox protein
MEKHEQAAEYIRGGWNCAQSVVKAYAEASGLSVEEDALLMASALGGGVGRTGNICGAVNGAALILGRRFGYGDPADAAGRERVYGLVRRLAEEFEREHGSVQCSELLGFDIRDETASREGREQGVFQKRCPLYVQSAARILEAILQGE